jgi:hypothetical protein
MLTLLAGTAVSPEAAQQQLLRGNAAFSLQGAPVPMCRTGSSTMEGIFSFPAATRPSGGAAGEDGRAAAPSRRSANAQPSPPLLCA